MRILTCVPEQRHTFKEKMKWIDKTATKNAPVDLFVTPQEYIGGIQQLFFNTGEPIAYRAEQVLEPVMKLAKKHDMGIAIGFVEDDPKLKERRERIYIVDPKKGPTGHFDKMVLPAYDHINAKGLTAISPESVLANRAQVAEVKGARVTILFCWEVYSNFIWHAMTMAQPDFVLSMIKFGVCGWPQKAKDKTGHSVVTGFGYGDDGGWIERLKMGAKWDVSCPVFCSTNGWKLPCRARPLAGMIWPFGESTLWHPEKGTRGEIPEHVQVDDFNPLVARFFRGNKFAYHEATGDWPPSEQRKHTMLWKVKRIERQLSGLSTSERPPTRQALPLIKKAVDEGALGL